MNEFKVGDEVTRECWIGSRSKYYIAEILDDGKSCRLRDYPQFTYKLTDFILVKELPKFKVGDFVQVVGAYGSGYEVVTVRTTKVVTKYSTTYSTAYRLDGRVNSYREEQLVRWVKLPIFEKYEIASIAGCP